MDANPITDADAAREAQIKERVAYHNYDFASDLTFLCYLLGEFEDKFADTRDKYRAVCENRIQTLAECGEAKAKLAEIRGQVTSVASPECIEAIARQVYERDFWGERAPKWPNMSEDERRPWLVRATETVDVIRRFVHV